MWVFTVDGFFSAVHDKYCDPGEVMVRARCHEDLRAMAKRLGIVITIINTPQADYYCRAKLKQDDWVRYVSTVAESIDYPSFKDAALTEKGTYRAIAYLKCWQVLHDWQDRLFY